jgi:hypothetical protein
VIDRVDPNQVPSGIYCASRTERIVHEDLGCLFGVLQVTLGDLRTANEELSYTSEWSRSQALIENIHDIKVETVPDIGKIGRREVLPGKDDYSGLCRSIFLNRDLQYPRVHEINLIGPSVANLWG